MNDSATAPSSLSFFAVRAVLACSLALVLAISAPSATAGVLVELETHSLVDPAKKVEQATWSIEGQNVRIDRTVDGVLQSSLIVLGELALIVDHQKKFLSTLDPASLEALAGQLKMAMAQLDERLQQMPPEQRELVEQTLRQGQPAQVVSKVEKTEKIAEKSGFSARQFRILRDDALIREVWAADWKTFELAAELQTAIKAMDRLYSRLFAAFESLRSAALGVQVFEMPPNPFEAQAQIDGFGVAIINFAEGRATSETTVKNLAKKSFDLSIFVPPASYEKKALYQ
jgi:hypothetical protein